MNKFKHGDLQVWWIPRLPMKEFRVSVPDARTAKLLLDTLADYDKFQYENNIKPDYSNIGGLQVWDDRIDFDENKWTDWEDQDGKDIDYTETFIWEGSV